MSDALFAVQQSIYDALAASTDVQSLLGNPARLYDHVPPGAVFPYAVLSTVSVKPYDDIDRIGFEQTVALDIWSRYRGTKEVKDIIQASYDALHRADLTVTSQVFISCEFTSADVIAESDGLTYRGEAHFTIITQST